MALTQISTKGIKDGTITGSDLATNVDLVDNQKLRVGTSQNLEIYNNSNTAFLAHTTGGIKLSVAGGSNQVQINKGVVDEHMAKFIADGGVELYHNNSKRFETTSYGNLSSAQVRVASSNATTVGFSLGDVGTGFYNSGSNAIGYSANGTQKWQINSAGDLNLADDVKGIFGDGLDLQIYHTGSNSNSNIRHINSAGSLYIDSANSTYFRHYIDSGGTISFENFAVFNDDGAVELYHDNSKKFETTSGGATITGALTTNTSGGNAVLGSHLDLGDNQKARFGASDDLEIYHDGSNSIIFDTGTGDLIVKTNGPKIAFTTGGGTEIAEFINNGACNLRHQATSRLTTTSIGVTVNGSVTSDELKLGNTEVLRWGSSDTAFIQGQDGASGYMKFGVNSVHMTINRNGTINLPDSNKITFGASTDLQIYHDGTHSYILNDGSNLNIGTTSGNNVQIYGQNIVRWLFTYDGHFLPSANNAYDIGGTSNRVRNIYTNDLNLSNEGSSNDVDGSWGSYTIQEGAENLFLINNRNGKKYKFNLTEVS